MSGETTENIIWNDKTDIYQYEDKSDKIIRKYVKIIVCFLSGSGAILNALIIVALLSLKGSLKTNLKLLLSLSICDLIIGILHVVLYFKVFVCFWTEHETTSLSYQADVLDLVLSSLYIIVQFAALNTMLLLSTDILIRVRYPLKYSQLMSKGRGFFITVSLWLIACVPVGYLIITGNKDFEFVNDVLSINNVFQSLSILFFAIISIFSIITYCAIRSFMRRQPTLQEQNTKKAAMTFLVILATYFVCLLPLMWEDAFYDPDHKLLIKALLQCLFVLNTIFDPIIYATRVPDIREKFTACFARFYAPASVVTISSAHS